jgi:hypothetical protein
MRHPDPVARRLAVFSICRERLTALSGVVHQRCETGLLDTSFSMSTQPKMEMRQSRSHFSETHPPGIDVVTGRAPKLLEAFEPAPLVAECWLSGTFAMMLIVSMAN